MTSRTARAGRVWVALAVAVYVGALGVIGVRAFLLLSAGCPGDAVQQQRDGLAVVRAELPPGSVREETLSDCDSGDRPFFTAYARGSGDPVRQLMTSNGVWSPQAPEPGDPPTGGSSVSRPFRGATLSVTSSAYTAEDWILSVQVVPITESTG
jgi:hypothetical protein